MLTIAKRRSISRVRLRGVQQIRLIFWSARLAKAKPLRLLKFSMDCRVKPGNDAVRKSQLLSYPLAPYPPSPSGAGMRIS
jgi:hypothetical protein